eukprot:CAMPEP_0173174686 /NCGR_PEP_ID=MMETSP1141-20130122/3487_1 /TAXON_ID=483371 /ORGANISM="non described non described, Strain CCMP2298" /LENGTH=198 /DNA_ID=CAMNT_0014096831 /DNA_START=199 /DNA_END=792 /DNA_ORIENTATION=+
MSASTPTSSAPQYPTYKVNCDAIFRRFNWHHIAYGQETRPEDTYAAGSLYGRTIVRADAQKVCDFDSRSKALFDFIQASLPPEWVRLAGLGSQYPGDGCRLWQAILSDFESDPLQSQHATLLGLLYELRQAEDETVFSFAERVSKICENMSGKGYNVSEGVKVEQFVKGLNGRFYPGEGAGLLQSLTLESAVGLVGEW